MFLSHSQVVVKIKFYIDQELDYLIRNYEFLILLLEIRGIIYWSNIRMN